MVSFNIPFNNSDKTIIEIKIVHINTVYMDEYTFHYYYKKYNERK